MTAQRPHGTSPWAEGPRSAALDRRHDLELAEADMAGVGGTPSRPAVAEKTSPTSTAGRDNDRASGGRLRLVQQQVERAGHLTERVNGDACIERRRVELLVSE